jgi:hypothetical protein
MDFASPYIDFVCEQTKEVCDIFGDEVDGFFFDIIFQHGVHSTHCLERFRNLGWDPNDKVKQQALRDLLVEECTDRIGGAVREKNKKATVFLNGGHVGPSFRRMIRNYSHLEVESLPNGGWGYMHFPITSRYARTLDRDYLGMTGKFSETWGHFNSYKNEAALEFECFSMLAQGGKCSVGDQLHPRGVLDEYTYDLIGSVYRQVAEVEPWCDGARAVTEIAVVNAELYDKSNERMDPRNLGAARMLIEGRHQFDFIDEEADLSRYKLLILADVIPTDGGFGEKVNQFLQAGGAVIASGQSGFGLDGFPVQKVGELPYSPDFLRPNAGLSPATTTDFVMYERGVEVKAGPGAEVLARVSDPYFNRSYDVFISHAHSPFDKVTDKPGVVQKGKIIYFAHPIFTTYAKHSMSFHRDIVLAAIKRLLPVPLVEVEGPTSLQATLTRQGDRHIVHLLHYIAERRGLNFDVIEDRMPVSESQVRVRVPGTKAMSVPNGSPLELLREGDTCIVTVPAFEGMAMIVIEP